LEDYEGKESKAQVPFAAKATLHARQQHGERDNLIIVTRF